LLLHPHSYIDLTNLYRLNITIMDDHAFTRLLCATPRLEHLDIGFKQSNSLHIFPFLPCYLFWWYLRYSFADPLSCRHRP
jgi:hypothetical protein